MNNRSFDTKCGLYGGYHYLKKIENVAVNIGEHALLILQIGICKNTFTMHDDKNYSSVNLK